jgi:thiol-disulfide isomerase/thioredoxin
MDKFTSVTKGSGLTVVDFWAPWCKNCGKMMPAVTKLAGEMTGAKFIKVKHCATIRMHVYMYACKHIDRHAYLHTFKLTQT